MRHLLTALALASVFACASLQLPQTRHDFREYSKQHDGVHQLTVASPFDQTVSRLRAHAEKCNTFGKSFTRTEGMGGNPAPMNVTSDTFAKWERVTANSATVLFIKKDHQILNQPKEGQIWFMIDLKRSGSGTAATLYDLNGPKWATYDFITEFTAVLEGKAGPCQLEAIQ